MTISLGAGWSFCNSSNNWVIRMSLVSWWVHFHTSNPLFSWLNFEIFRTATPISRHCTSHAPPSPLLVLATWPPTQSMRRSSPLWSWWSGPWCMPPSLATSPTSCSVCTAESRSTTQSGATWRSSQRCTRCQRLWNKRCKIISRRSGRSTTASTLPRWRRIPILTEIDSQVLADYPEELRGDVSMHLHKEVSISHLLLPLTAGYKCPILSTKKNCNNCIWSPTGPKSAPVWNGFPRMPEVNLLEDQNHLLRPRWVPGAQGGRPAQYLLSLQRLYGGAAGWDGCGNSR